MKMSVISAAAVGVLVASAGISEAATYYARIKDGISPITTNNWDATSNWTDAADGNAGTAGVGGTGPASMGGHHFFIGTTAIIQTNSSSNTFPGASLNLAGGRIEVRGNDSSVKTANMGATGTSRIFWSTSKSSTATAIELNTPTFNNASGATTSLDLATGSTGSTVNEFSKLTIGTLTGSGNFSLMSTNGVGANQTRALVLSVTNGTTFTGNIVWGTNNTALPRLQFGNGLSIGGGLIATDTYSRIVLDQNITVGSLTLNGNSLGAGTYDYTTYLNANYDTIFVNGGSGSITVVPEPTAIGLAAAFVLPLVTRRRNRTS